MLLLATGVRSTKLDYELRVCVGTIEESSLDNFVLTYLCDLLFSLIFWVGITADDYLDNVYSDPSLCLLND